jgi:hypothetical protein
MLIRYRNTEKKNIFKKKVKTGLKTETIKISCILRIQIFSENSRFYYDMSPKFITNKIR